MTLEMIKAIVAEYPQPEYRTILREPIAIIIKGCLEPIKGGGWQSPEGAKSPEPIKPSDSKD